MANNDWTVREDEQLCMAVCFNAVDGRIVRNGTRREYWQQIYEDFLVLDLNDRGRTAISLCRRFTHIIKHVKRYIEIIRMIKWIRRAQGLTYVDLVCILNSV